MTQDEVIVMAKQAWADAGDAWVAKEWFDDRVKAFEAFAKLVAAKAIKELESQEPYGWVSQHTTKGMYEWQFNKEIAGVYQDTAISILPVYTHSPQRTEQNYCPRCGKRTNDIHTCTPPQRSESSGKPSAWVGLTNEELTDLFYNTNLGQQSAVSQAVALLKERNS